MELQQGALLQGGKYKIEKSLGQGGFGITYLAEQTNLGRKVCIKEFFMKDYGERTTSQEVDSEETVLTNGAPMSSQASNDKDSTVLTGVSAVTSAAAAIMGRYREKFVKEARTIARLDHPGIVRIHDVFEENGTAYYVMDFIEGENLNDLVKREGALSEERALEYIRQVADALSYVHEHRIMHLDVKPANIIIRKSDDKAILIDFGTAKQYDSKGTQTSTTPVGLSVGYAPIEMTKPGGVQTFSPETDVYSLGATLYYLVTGKNPPDASERMEMIMEGEKFQLPDIISNSTAEVIEQSMQARKKRIQDVSGFLELLNSDGEKRRLEAEEKAAKEADAKRQEELRIEREKADAERRRIAEEKAQAEKNCSKERQSNGESTKKEIKKNNKTKTWLIGLLAVILVGGFALFLYNSQKRNSSYAADQIFQNATSAYNNGDYAEASRLFEEAAKYKADNWLDCIYNAAFTAANASNFDRAKQFYNKCLDQGYAAEGNVYAALSNCALAEKDTTAAKQYLADGLKNYPDNPSILTNLINLYVQMKEDPVIIINLLDKAKAQMPDNPSLYYVEGNILTGIKDFDGALKAYRKASEIDPNYVWGYYGEGSLWLQKQAALVDEANALPVSAYKEYDDKMEEIAQCLKNAVPAFETCYAKAGDDKNLKDATLDFLKRIYYALRNEGSEYQAQYEKYNSMQ